MALTCWKCGAVVSGNDLHSDAICISLLRHRIEELESKLGAASSSVDSGIASGCLGSHATPLAEPTEKREASTAAAPSVSLYIRWGTEHQQDDILAADRLAAAVTEWWDRYYHAANFSEQDVLRVHLLNLAKAFVRGEPLPEKMMPRGDKP